MQSSKFFFFGFNVSVKIQKTTFFSLLTVKYRIITYVNKYFHNIHIAYNKIKHCKITKVFFLSLPKISTPFLGRNEIQALEDDTTYSTLEF